MRYEVHITRASEWSQNEGQEITREEWLAQVQSDPELALDLQNGPCFAVWSRPSQNPDPWIDWFNGDLFTKNQATCTDLDQSQYFLTTERS